MWPLRGLGFFKSPHHYSSSSGNEISSDHNQGYTLCVSDCHLENGSDSSDLLHSPALLSHGISQHLWKAQAGTAAVQLAGDPLGMSSSALEMLEPRAATSQHTVKVLGPRSGDFSHPKEAFKYWGWFSHCRNRNIWDLT